MIINTEAVFTRFYYVAFYNLQQVCTLKQMFEGNERPDTKQRCFVFL